MRAVRSFIAEFNVESLFHGWPLTTLMAGCVLVHWRFTPQLGRLLPLVYDGIYMLVPLAFIAALASRRLLSRLAFAAVTALVTGPLFYAKLYELPRTWATDNPPSVVIPAMLAAVVTLATTLQAKPNLDAWMIGPGDWRWWAPRLGVAIGIIVPAAALAVVLSPSLQAFYPSDPEARGSLFQLFLAQVSRGGGLLGEEFFWHGLLLAGLAQLYGRPAALVITSFGYFAIHKSKPELEMASSWVGAMLLGAACLRCRSFWPAFLGHWPMNVTVELTAYALAGPRSA
jgi:membrane protease YdiL (CAAX protease family)